MTQGVVSAIIVSYNSREDLMACIPTLLKQDVPLEVIVVDNCSTDGTVAWLHDTYPQIHVISRVTNDGYAGGNNVGAEAATGEFLFFVNPDTELFPGAIAQLLQTAVQCPGSIVTPKLIQRDGTINTCGNQVHFTGITTCQGLGKRAESFRGVFPVTLVSGAAFLVSKQVWDDVGGFSPDYFMYMEDMEFSLRARLLGYHILCCADSVILHKWKLGMGENKFFHLERNRLLTLLKLYERKTLFRLSPSLLLTEISTWAYALMKGVPFLRARWNGYISIWQTRKQWLEGRRKIQRQRKIHDAELLTQMLSTLPFDMLVSPKLSKLLTKTTTPLYKPFYVWGTRT